MPYLDKINKTGSTYDIRDSGAVRFDEAQTLTTAQKQQALENVGFDDALGASAVRYDGSQSLSAGQKVQVQNNLGIATQLTAAMGAIRFDAQQTLTDDQRSRARSNLAIPTLLKNSAVLFNATQELTAEQQAQARNNIGIDSTLLTGAVRYDSEQSLTDAQQALARGNIGAADGAEFAAVMEDFTPEVTVGPVAEVAIDDAAEMDAERVVVYLEPVQSGEDNPSPTNVRPIAGWTVVGLTLNDEEISVSLPASADTVYGGTLDLTNGTLVVDRKLFTVTTAKINASPNTGYSSSTGAAWVRNLNYSEGISTVRYGDNNPAGLCMCNFAEKVVLNNNDISSSQYRTSFKGPWTTLDGFKAAVADLEQRGITPCYVAKLNTSLTYELTPQQIALLRGANTLSADAGNVEMTYHRDLTMLLAKIPETLDTFNELNGTVEAMFKEPISMTLNDGYINNDGTRHDQDETNLEVYATYFQAVPGEKIIITLSNPEEKANWLAVARRGVSNNWLGRTELIGTTNRQASVEVEYTVPQETDIMSITYRTYGSITVTAKREKTAFYPRADGEALESRVTAIENGEITKKNVVRPKQKVYSTNHRGWNACPENTLAAYRQSAAHGFPQVETDVRFTSDNVPVLLHDSTINRTARNADGTTISGDVSISSITLAQALEYDFGVYKGSGFAGEKIPTLAQMLNLCRKLGLIPYLEIEGTLTTEKAQIIADVVNASGIRNDVVFISNEVSSLKALLPYFPRNRFGVSPWTYADSYREAAVSMFNDKAEIFMHMSVSQVTSSIIESLQADNIPLELWVTDAAAIRAADEYVSGFTSNDAVASDVLYASEIPNA